MLGFAELRAALGPARVGECLVDEHYNSENGDALQETTGGLLVWRKADNFTAFTDGSRTWVRGPTGIRSRLNSERFPWEAATLPGSVREAAWPLSADQGIYRIGAPQPIGRSCTGERWAVRTLSDTGAPALDTRVQDATVAALRGMGVPAVSADTTRLSGVETTVYRVPVQLVSASATDSGMDVVVVDPADSSATLIVTLPDALCASALASRLSGDLTRARGAFAAACGTFQPWTTTPIFGSAVITGVGYVSPSRPAGSAPNRLGLSPILAFEARSCARGAPTPTAAASTPTPAVTPTPIVVTATPTATPSPAPTVTATAELLDRGFGQGLGNTMGYAFHVRNTDATQMLSDSRYQVAAYDATGRVLATDASYVHRLLPGEIAAVGGSMYLPDKAVTARIEVQVLAGTLGPVGSAVGCATSSAAYRADQFFPKVTGLVTNPAAAPVKNLRISAVLYDAAGKIVGGGFTYLDFVPARDNSAVEVSVSGAPPSRVELYASTTVLSELP